MGLVGLSASLPLTPFVCWVKTPFSPSLVLCVDTYTYHTQGLAWR